MKYDDKKCQLFDNILAGILTAVILGGLAFAIATWIIPWGCYTRADKMSSLWGCIIPGITIVSSVFLAFMLPIVFFITNRIALSLANRWYIIAFVAALLTQLLVSSVSIIVAMPLHAGLTYSAVAFVPHGFAVGFGCGIFYCILRLAVKKSRQRIDSGD